MAHTLRPAARGHGGREHPTHPWPTCEADWNLLADCRDCGIAMLRLFMRSAEWVVRRVERIEFLDERTVRRRMSVDYTSPGEGAVRLRRGDRDLRVLPLAVLRRKSLIKFDLRDEDGRPMPLLGLRETQALTLGAVRAWAAAALAGTEWETTGSARLPDPVARFLDGVVVGDQNELNAAYRDMNDAREGSRSWRRACWPASRTSTCRPATIRRRTSPRGGRSPGVPGTAGGAGAGAGRPSTTSATSIR
ncbi:MAG: hypothetical protein ACRDLY_04625, partial [Thermoleophilaceae bacterium]